MRQSDNTHEYKNAIGMQLNFDLQNKSTAQACSNSFQVIVSN